MCTLEKVSQGVETVVRLEQANGSFDTEPVDQAEIETIGEEMD